MSTIEGAQDPNNAAEPQTPQCQCGHDTDHYMVSKVGDYTFWGWLAFTLGISAVPRQIAYQCRICKDVIAVTTDPETLRGGIR